MIKKDIAKLEQELKDLKKAFETKCLSTNEYCDFVYAISQQIIKLRKLI